MSQKIASLYAEIGANTTGFEKGAAKVKGGLGNLASEIGRTIPPGVVQFASWSGAILAVGGAISSTINETARYAQEVRDLSQTSGQTTEDTSRMLQVMDDFQLTAGDATTAVRALTKEGLAPSMETLAQLADRYVTLNSAQEKNEFILKNLGKSGLQWANMLSKGGDALRDMSSAVDDSLVLTKDNINAAEDYRLALDDWNDAIMGVKVSLGNELLPVLADVLDGLTSFSDVSLELQKTTDYANMSIFERARAVIEGTRAVTEQEQAERAAASAIQDSTAATEDNTAAAEDNATALKEQSRANQQLLSDMFSIQSDMESFAQDEESRASRQRDLDAERIQLAMERQSVLSEIALVKENDDIKESQRQDKLIDLNQKLNDLTVDGLKLTEQESQLAADAARAMEEKADAAQRVVYNLLEQKAAADGLVTSDETRFLQDTAVSMGLVDRASADAAIQAAETADQFWAGFQQTGQAMTTLETTVTKSTDQMGADFLKVQGPMDKTRLLMQAIAAYDGRVIHYGVEFSTTGSVPGSSDLGLSPIGGGRAAGGPVVRGHKYIVGERGPEMFVPQTSGRITPNTQLKEQDKRNVVNNFYFTGSVRGQNDLDWLAQEVTRRQSQ